MHAMLRTSFAFLLLLAVKAVQAVEPNTVVAQPTVPTVDSTRTSPPAQASTLPEQTQRAADATIKGRFSTTDAGQITGEVTINWDNGDRYTGRMEAGKRQGTGRFEWANGQRYEGEWKNDLPEGRGALLFSNGDRYEGEVRNGVPHGFGSKTFAASGERYEGSFVAGLPEGSGKLSGGGNSYDGQWRAGLKHGKGRYQWSNGQTYEGGWVQDQPEGEGEFLFANGDRYTGSVKYGSPEGRGKKVFSSGDRYEGDFKAGLENGQGSYLWKNGDLYQGAWSAGRKNGAGRYTWANGDFWEGNYAADRQLDGRLHFTPRLEVAQEGLESLMQQTRAASNSGGTQPSVRPLDASRMAGIPMVALELKACDGPDARLDCRQKLLQEIDQGRHFRHQWHTMFSEKGAGKAATSYEVDRNSSGEAGRVFSWFRFVDSANGSSRNTGIKYDCRSEALDIQLLFNCTGDAKAPTCQLDRNFDKYVGKTIPASTIKGWFKSACERGE